MNEYAEDKLRTIERLGTKTYAIRSLDFTPMALLSV
jgi:hypothetical protein